MEDVTDDELNNDREYWAGMAEKAAEQLPKYRSLLTQQLVTVIQDRTDRDRAVHLSKRVFDIEYKKTSPEEYEAGLKEFNEILARYGVNNSIG